MEENKTNAVVNQPKVASAGPLLTHSVMVETYAEDMASAMSTDMGAGSIKNIIHGEEENEALKRNLSPESKKNKLFLSLGILFLVVAFIGVIFSFIKNIPKTALVVEPFVPIIFSDKSVSVDITGLKKDKIVQSVLGEVNNAPIKAGAVEGIYLSETNKAVGLRRFVSLISSNFTPNSNIQFVSDNFLMGVVKNQANTPSTSGAGFFILLKMRSNTDIFDSMRAWEPNLLSDMHEFLGISIGSDTSYLFTKDFKDGIIENKNARILYDKAGNIVIMYIFADDNSVVITDSESAAHEVMLRLVLGQAKH